MTTSAKTSPRSSPTSTWLTKYLISGGNDYLVRFMTRSIQHYQGMMEVLLDKNIGISKYFSYIVIKSPVHKDGVPLRKLLSQQ